jgi:hypothetical protein
MPNFKSASNSLVHPLWMDDIPRIYLAGKIHQDVHWRSELTGRDARLLSVPDPEVALDPNYSELIDGVTGLPPFTGVGQFFVSLLCGKTLVSTESIEALIRTAKPWTPNLARVKAATKARLKRMTDKHVPRKLGASL